MKFGLPLSLILHALVLFGGGLFWSSKVEPIPDVKVVSLDIVTVAERTNIKEIHIEKPKEEPKEQAVTKPLEKKPEPSPNLKVVEKQVEKNPAEVENVEQEKKPSQQVSEKIEPKQPSFNLDDFANMVDKTRKDKPNVNTQKALTHETERAKHAQNAVGEATELTVSPIDYIKAKMEPCWHIDTGQEDYKSLRVEVVLNLTNKGEIIDVNVRNSAQIIASANSAWRAARENVLSALNKCEPYDGLMSLDYDTWKTIKMNFQPGDI